ncbi:MAG: DUF167 domain-containing protein [Hyphomicrobiales bacterium]|nr:MAG: DUF167 domain-containing protein [Hyphomicrobiales bacterium]
MAEAWTPVPAGLRLDVRLTPKAGRDEVSGLGDGPEGPVLKVRVRAVPEDGKANAALIATVADWLGLPKSSLALASGGKSRNKALLLNGDPEALVARIRARLAGSRSPKE